MGSFFVRKALQIAACRRFFLAITGDLVRHLFPENLRTSKRDPIGGIAATIEKARAEKEFWANDAKAENKNNQSPPLGAAKQADSKNAMPPPPLPGAPGGSN